MVLGLLSHILHPNGLIAPVKLSESLLGVALVAPWGDFRTTAPAYSRNAYKDSDDAAVLSKWATWYMGRADADPYNQPFRASAPWWEHLESAVRSILITAGRDEVFVDDIEVFARTIKVRIHILGLLFCR